MPPKPTLRKPPTTTLFSPPRPTHNSISHEPLHSSQPFSTTSPRPARLLRRPKRPYTFTQLITLSDGSTFTQRTTSPLAVYKSAKDARNTPLWNPSNVKMANVEEDEAGRLRAFRRRFGRGWDARSEELGGTPALEDQQREAIGGEEREGEMEGAVSVQEGVGVRVQTPERGERSEGRQGRDHEGRIQSESQWSDEAEDNLMDLIGSYGVQGEKEGSAAGLRGDIKGVKKGKGKR